MKKIFNFFLALLVSNGSLWAQADIYPTSPNKGLIFITHATIHVGDGRVILDGSILINNGKIEKVGTHLSAPVGAVEVFDVAGKQVYPGLISSITNLGIKEVEGAVRGTDDYDEIGTINPSIRSIVAYNTDSRVVNVLRSNGILLANVIPQDEDGSNQLISGSSSVVQLDAWNWEDAAYQMDGQMQFNMPSVVVRRRRFSSPASGNGEDPVKRALGQIEGVKEFFRAAKKYLSDVSHQKTNLNYEATRKLFDKKQQFFVHCNGVKEMLLALDFKKEFGFEVVIVGGADSWQIAPILKENAIPVILGQPHSLPLTTDDDVDQPYKTPYLLQKAGVLFAIADNNGETRGRNLMFNAGTASAYGLTREEALSSITLNAAKILGIDSLTGSIEEGKDANIIVSQGDILDMDHSIVELAFIQGRKINLSNHQTKLADRYWYKYGLK